MPLVSPRPLVSYVATLFNKRAFLPYVIAGLAAQTGDFDRQYIFVDDGSSDDTVDVLRDLVAGWENVEIVQQENQGPSAALNVGLARASGEYIKPLDGDDVLAPWATEELLQAMKKAGTEIACCRPECVGIYTVGDAVDDVLDSFPKSNATFQAVDLLPLSVKRPQTNPTAWMATRAIVERTGGSDTSVFVQDYSIELRLASLGRIAVVNALIYKAQKEDEARLSANAAQIIHDVNAALIGFLIENYGQISPAVTRYGLRRAAYRSMAWARRHEGKGIVSREFLYLMLALSGLLKPSDEVRRVFCRSFQETDTIRLPGHPT